MRGVGFRVNGTHFPERKCEEYFEKSVVSRHGDRAARVSRMAVATASAVRGRAIGPRRGLSAMGPHARRRRSPLVVGLIDRLGSWQSLLLHDFDRS